MRDLRLLYKRDTGLDGTYEMEAEIDGADLTFASVTVDIHNESVKIEDKYIEDFSVAGMCRVSVDPSEIPYVQWLEEKLLNLMK